ncbi:hypothetical protein [Lentzea fradiae]|nr:hypothetical protein [Lentzea fradiae]
MLVILSEPISNIGSNGGRQLALTSYKSAPASYSTIHFRFGEPR